MTVLEPQSELIDLLLRKQLWLAIAQRVPGGPEIQPLLDAHLRRQLDLERRGVLFAAGPLTGAGSPSPQLVGMTIVRAASRESAAAILDDDPLHSSGATTYDLYEWSLNEGNVGISVELMNQSITFH